MAYLDLMDHKVKRATLAVLAYEASKQKQNDPILNPNQIVAYRSSNSNWKFNWKLVSNFRFGWIER